VGLPNIMAREFLVPERLQEAASPEQLAKDILNWLDHPAQMDAVRQRFVQIHEQLRCNTARRATDAIAQVLESR
jgi:lipid-A-disaccharide synthase